MVIIENTTPRENILHKISLAFDFVSSTVDILLYRILYFSIIVRHIILITEGKSITIATTSNLPPTDAGIPKSVKHKKNHCITEQVNVPAKGLNIVIHSVFSLLSPITLDTIINFLSR